MNNSILTCSKCKLTQSKNNFYKKTKTRLQSYCKQCFNQYCMKRWIDKKIAAIFYLGGKCIRCCLTLDDAHHSVFEFHHKNPDTKLFDWKKLRMQSKTTIQTELDKCLLVCANCHRMIHAELNKTFPEQPKSH